MVLFVDILYIKKCLTLFIPQIAGDVFILRKTEVYIERIHITNTYTQAFYTSYDI